MSASKEKIMTTFKDRNQGALNACYYPPRKTLNPSQNGFNNCNNNSSSNSSNRSNNSSNNSNNSNNNNNSMSSRNVSDSQNTHFSSLPIQNMHFDDTIPRGSWERLTSYCKAFPKYPCPPPAQELRTDGNNISTFLQPKKQEFRKVSQNLVQPLRSPNPWSLQNQVLANAQLETKDHYGDREMLNVVSSLPKPETDPSKAGGKHNLTSNGHSSLSPGLANNVVETDAKSSNSRLNANSHFKSNNYNRNDIKSGSSYSTAVGGSCAIFPFVFPTTIQNSIPDIAGKLTCEAAHDNALPNFSTTLLKDRDVGRGSGESCIRFQNESNGKTFMTSSAKNARKKGTAPISASYNGNDGVTALNYLNYLGSHNGENTKEANASNISNFHNSSGTKRLATPRPCLRQRHSSASSSMSLSPFTLKSPDRGHLDSPYSKSKSPCSFPAMSLIIAPTLCPSVAAGGSTGTSKIDRDSKQSNNMSGRNKKKTNRNRTPRANSGSAYTTPLSLYGASAASGSGGVGTSMKFRCDCIDPNVMHPAVLSCAIDDLYKKQITPALSEIKRRLDKCSACCDYLRHNFTQIIYDKIPIDSNSSKNSFSNVQKTESFYNQMTDVSTVPNDPSRIALKLNDTYEGQKVVGPFQKTPKAANKPGIVFCCAGVRDSNNVGEMFDEDLLLMSDNDSDHETTECSYPLCNFLDVDGVSDAGAEFRNNTPTARRQKICDKGHNAAGSQSTIFDCSNETLDFDFNKILSLLETILKISTAEVCDLTTGKNYNDHRSTSLNANKKPKNSTVCTSGTEKVCAADEISSSIFHPDSSADLSSSMTSSVENNKCFIFLRGNCIVRGPNEGANVSNTTSASFPFPSNATSFWNAFRISKMFRKETEETQTIITFAAYPDQSFAGFVDPTSPHFPYPKSAICIAAIYLLQLVRSGVTSFRAGRFLMAQELKRHGPKKLRRMTLGQLCHLVQLLLSNNFMSYDSHFIRPVVSCVALTNATWARITSQCLSYRNPKIDLIRSNIVSLLGRYPSGIMLSQLRNTYELHFRKSLEFNHLGYTKLAVFFREELSDVCVMLPTGPFNCLVVSSDTPGRRELLSESRTVCRFPVENYDIAWPSASPSSISQMSQDQLPQLPQLVSSSQSAESSIFSEMLKNIDSNCCVASKLGSLSNGSDSCCLSSFIGGSRCAIGNNRTIDGKNFPGDTQFQSDIEDSISTAPSDELCCTMGLLQSQNQEDCAITSGLASSTPCNRGNDETCSTQKLHVGLASLKKAVDESVDSFNSKSDVISFNAVTDELGALRSHHELVVEENDCIGCPIYDASNAIRSGENISVPSTSDDETNRNGDGEDIGLYILQALQNHRHIRQIGFYFSSLTSLPMDDHEAANLLNSACTGNGISIIHHTSATLEAKLIPEI